MNQNKRILHLALPMILSNLTVPLLGLVDTAVMGHLNHAMYLAAVGIGTMIFNFVYYAFGFLRMGTTGLIAQALGQDDTLEAQLVLLRAMLIALGLSLVFILLQYPILHIALHFVKAKAAIQNLTSHYFYWRIWGAPAVLINFALLGTFIGLHKPRWALLTSTIVNVVAMMLDIALVYGLHMNVKGVALSNVISQYIGVGASLYLLKSYFGPWRHINKHALLCLKKLKALFHLNKDIFLRTLSLIIVFTFFTRESARFGVIVLAANMVLFNFQDIMAFALDGFANAAEALVGEAFGKKDSALYNSAIKSTGRFSFIVAILFSLIYALFGTHIINLMTSISAVRHMANAYLPFVIITPIISVWSFWLDGILIGTTQSKLMRNTMFIAAISFFALFWPLSHYGNIILWSAFLLFMLMRAIAIVTLSPITLFKPTLR